MSCGYTPPAPCLLPVTLGITLPSLAPSLQHNCLLVTFPQCILPVSPRTTTLPSMTSFPSYLPLCFLFFLPPSFPAPPLLCDSPPLFPRLTVIYPTSIDRRHILMFPPHICAARSPPLLSSAVSISHHLLFPTPFFPITPIELSLLHSF